MNEQEVEALRLWDINSIRNFRRNFNPTVVAAIIGDTHTGANRTLAEPMYTMLTGQKIKCDNLSSRIYSCWKKYWELVDTWKADKVFHLGDAVSATVKLAGTGRDFLPLIDDQREMVINLLKPHVKDREFHIISGSKFHDSLDTKVHFEIAQRLGGKFYPEQYILTKLDQVAVFMSHKHRSGSLYPLGVMERDAIFSAYGIATNKIDKIHAMISGHWHQYAEINNGITETIIPCWQGYYALKGGTRYLGIRQPDIGGLILLVRNKYFVTIPYIFKIKTMGV